MATLLYARSQSVAAHSDSLPSRAGMAPRVAGCAEDRSSAELAAIGRAPEIRPSVFGCLDHPLALGPLIVHYPVTEPDCILASNSFISATWTTALLWRRSS